MAESFTWQWLIGHLEILIGFSIGVVLVTRVLRQRRSPTGTMAWLLAIVLIPYVGVPLYVMLGGRKMKRSAAGKLKTHFSRPSMRLNIPQTKVDELLESYNLPPACGGNHLELLTDGCRIYHRLAELIDKAKSSIYISTFIFRTDPVGKDILSRLTEKARQGLDVRVLLDGFGAVQTGGRFFKPLVAAGGKYDFFMHRMFRGRTNLRNHRKIALFDSRIVLAGGSNIGSEYIGPVPDSKRWSDLSFVLEGPAVMGYREIFNSDWAFTTGQRLEIAAENPNQLPFSDSESVTVQVVPSGPDVEGDPLYDAIMTAIFTAQHSIQIVTPYFIPDEPLLNAIQLAVRRGVDVRIIVPAKSNHPLTDLARGIYLRDVSQSGAKVYYYAHGMIHAKAILVDRTLVMIGSANMDSRSLFLNYEAMLIVYSPKPLLELREWMDAIEQKCQKQGLEAGFVRTMLEHVLQLFAPLL
jgi:cardiolipin synthase